MRLMWLYMAREMLNARFWIFVILMGLLGYDVR